MWTILTVAGPLILAGVLLWAMLRSRRESPREVERTEQATRDLYRDENAAHADEDREVP